MNLYEVQDADRPVYVLAESWEGALRFWARRIARENEIPIDDIESPKGVRLVAENTNKEFPEVFCPGMTTITRIPAAKPPAAAKPAQPVEDIIQSQRQALNLPLQTWEEWKQLCTCIIQHCVGQTQDARPAQSGPDIDEGW